MHRIIGINKVSEEVQDNRFLLVRKYGQHLKVYASIAVIGSIITFIILPISTKIHLIAPSVISGLYILPIFFKGKRLRDFNYIKIFLVAISYALLCGVIPLISLGLSPKILLLIFIEKMFFIFAITLPFDYRDRKVDTISNVKTLSQKFENHLPLLIVASFVISLVCMFINPQFDIPFKVALGIIYILLLIITLWVYNKDNDFYISGILDATMILFLLGVISYCLIYHLPINYTL